MTRYMYTDSLNDLHRLVEAVKAAGADVAPTYCEYVQLAFAIATDCGEAGRDAFHSLCSFSSKYDSRHADRLFTNALRTGRRNVHLGTAFHLAAQCGVQVAPPDGVYPENGSNGSLFPGTFTPTHARVREKHATPDDAYEANDSSGGGGESLREGSDPYAPLPAFPQDYEWPSLLNHILSYGGNACQRDALLLGAFTVLGASMAHVVRCLYGRQWQAPCLQVFVTAPSASGKRVLSWVRLLVMPIHDEVRNSVAQAMKQYRREKAEYDSLGKERKNHESPVMPPNKMFIIPGNNTSTGILQNLIDSDGTGIICETEADTVSAAIGTEYGNWSDTLRKAFDHGPLAYNRRMDREYKELDKIFLSVLMSGTPAQVKPFIPSAENGLFSRQLFYYMSRLDEWVDQFDHEGLDVEESFRRMGNEWKKQLDGLKRLGMFTLQLNAGQKAEFNLVFHRLFRRARVANGDEMNSFVARLAVNACRMMCVVAMLRYCEQPSLAVADTTLAADNLADGIITRWNLSVTADDFHAVLALVEPLYCHATHVLSFLSPTDIKTRGTSDRDRLFASMDEVFLRRDLFSQADLMGIPHETVNTWLKRLCAAGSIWGVDRGIYQKKQ